MADAPPEIVDELYGLGLDEFTAARDARAKELRASGDRAGAAAVKALRKPTVSAWAVNQLARRERDTVASLLAAGEALRRAQSALGEGGGEARVLRDAGRDERGAVDALAAAAAELLGSAGAHTLEEVRETLHAAASDEEARELVERGRLTKPRQAVGLGGLEAFAASAARPPKRAKAAPKGKAAPGPKPKPKADERAAARAAAERARRKERVIAARRELKEAERTAAESRRAAEAAAAEVERRRKALEREEGT